MYVELSHSLLLQLHHPVPPPPAHHPLLEGKQLWKFLHSHNYILHHPVPPPAVRPIPEGEQLHVCRIITFTALTITSSSTTSSRTPPPRR